MNSPQRNFLVGLMALGAILVLAWMITEFSGRSASLFFAPPQMTIHLDCEKADGLSEGSSVNYLGVAVGRITSVKLRPDGGGVLIGALINRKPPLPANVDAKIVQYSAIGGGSNLNLELVGDKPQGELQPDTTLEAQYVGLQLIPPGIANTAREIGSMSDEIRKIAEELRQSGTLKDLDKAVRNLNEQITKAGKVMDSANTILADRDNQKNIHDALGNIRNASLKLDTLAASLKDTSNRASTAVDKLQGHVDDLSKQIADRLVQVSGVLASIQSITDKMDKGKGTAGQLVNDPQLYQSLVDTVRQLNATTTDLHRLVDQWEQEGVTLHL
jgi:phospholipid/cholesterol/gamma-HCH transport system substrate-binding protein